MDNRDYVTVVSNIYALTNSLRGIGLSPCDCSGDRAVPVHDCTFPPQFLEHTRRVWQLQLLRPQHLVHNAECVSAVTIGGMCTYMFLNER